MGERSGLGLALWESALSLNSRHVLNEREAKDGSDIQRTE